MKKISRQEIAQRVNQSSQNYYFSEQQRGIDNRIKKLMMLQLLPYIRGDRVLELGFVDGMFTDVMLRHGLRVAILEGAAKHVNYARKKYEREKNITITHDYFETFDTQDKFNTILAGDMIQYLDDPVSFFSKSRSWLRDDGVVLVTTPNSRSFHRRIGSYLGISTHPGKVTSHEQATGNIMMYDQYQLRDVLIKSGLCVHFVKGCFLKPLSSRQMEAWDDSLLNAFLQIGNELGEYCWFLIAYCTKK